MATTTAIRHSVSARRRMMRLLFCLLVVAAESVCLPVASMEHGADGKGPKGKAVQLTVFVDLSIDEHVSFLSELASVFLSSGFVSGQVEFEVVYHMFHLPPVASVASSSSLSPKNNKDENHQDDEDEESCAFAERNCLMDRQFCSFYPEWAKPSNSTARLLHSRSFLVRGTDVIEHSLLQLCVHHFAFVTESIPEELFWRYLFLFGRCCLPQPSPNTTCTSAAAEEDRTRGGRKQRHTEDTHSPSVLHQTQRFSRNCNEELLSFLGISALQLAEDCEEDGLAQTLLERQVEQKQSVLPQIHLEGHRLSSSISAREVAMVVCEELSHRASASCGAPLCKEALSSSVDRQLLSGKSSRKETLTAAYQSCCCCWRLEEEEPEFVLSSSPVKDWWDFWTQFDWTQQCRRKPVADNNNDSYNNSVEVAKTLLHKWAESVSQVM